MAEFLKCACNHCGTSYRLPTEFQGRRARCKKCGEKFEVPKLQRSLEDSVLDWLNEEETVDETPSDRPREINIPKGEANAPHDSGLKMKASSEA